jgi:UDP-glucose 6-dehydrogenase
MIIEKLLEEGVHVCAYDPARTARESILGETWGSSVELSDSAEAACARAQAILVAVDDPRYGSVGSTAASGVTIVDPWGCVEGAHPGLVRPGRNS